MIEITPAELPSQPQPGPNLGVAEGPTPITMDQARMLLLALATPTTEDRRAAGICVVLDLLGDDAPTSLLGYAAELGVYVRGTEGAS